MVPLEAITHAHLETFFLFVSKCQSNNMLIQNFQIKKKIQIKKEDKELFDISNKFFQICELLKEYEVISIKWYNYN